MNYDTEYQPFELEETEFDGEGDFGSSEFDQGFEFESTPKVRLKNSLNIVRIGDRSGFEQPRVKPRTHREISEEIAPPTDDRQPVADTTGFPFRFICHVRVGFTTGRGGPYGTMEGTGFLIGTKYVLTAGHNIIRDIEYKGRHYTAFAHKITVTPGLNTSRPQENWRPFGEYPANRWIAHSKWNTPGWNEEFDYGLITLKNDAMESDDPLGYWGSRAYGRGTQITVFKPDQLKDKVVNVCGYPSDKCGDQPLTGNCPKGKAAGTQFMASDKIMDPSPAAQPRLLYHQVDTAEGQSGGPLWGKEKDSGKQYLIGVHTGGFHDAKGAFVRNRAVRITNEVLAQLRTWGWRA
ncbi:MAG: hypothetical protein C5B51_01760 [Terriglobia bacterium]|nr:MAG: hypothetical protein C5B51_01760 [Terriglobia bacterium]